VQARLLAQKKLREHGAPPTPAPPQTLPIETGHDQSLIII
jgi:hypothetical protein